MTISFLGTGIMGGPMAANLAKAGHTVRVWNRTPAKAAVAGTTAAGAPAEAVAGAEVVGICLSDTAAVEEVAAGFLDAIQPGTIVADSSTISPRASSALAEQVAGRGGAWVDC